MRLRGCVLLAALAALACLAADCGGGSGTGGARSRVETAALDPRCGSLGPSQFPPGFDFVPGDAARLVGLLFSPSLALAIDVAGDTPRVLQSPPILALPDDSDGDGAAEGSASVPDFPLLDGVTTRDPALAAAGLGLLSASNYEEVIFFRPDAGALYALEAELPAGARPEDFPRIPPNGAPALRTAISTHVCLKPDETLDSFGEDYAAGLPDFVFCDPAQRGSFFASFTSGAAVAAGRLFASMSNVGSRAGMPDTQFLPGAVLVYRLELGSAPRVSPDPDAPFILTQGFNPTHVTRFALRGREFILVTVTGAIGIQADDPTTTPIEAGTIVLSDASIEVIDAQTLSLVGSIPLGPAALVGDRLAIDPSGRVAVSGSRAGRMLLAVDLEALASLPASAPEPIALPDAVIFDAYAPLRIPAAANGPVPETCPGNTAGFAFNDAGDRIYVSEGCDGTLTRVGVALPVDRGDPVPPSSFFLIDSEAITAPLTPDTLGELRGPGELRVRPGVPGVDFDGPEVFFLASQPDSSVCGIHVESF
jgi:hypothetical protein